MSDLADLSTAHGARLPSFADDFTLYASSESPTAACDRVSSVLKRLKSCLDDRGLEINSGQTVAMLISPSRSRMPTIDFRINLDGAELKFVKQTRLLGGSLLMTPCPGLITSTLFAAKLAERLERLDGRFVC